MNWNELALEATFYGAGCIVSFLLTRKYYKKRWKSWFRKETCHVQEITGAKCHLCEVKT